MLIGIFLFLPEISHASTTVQGLPWETPMEKFVNSIKGPVAFFICLLGLIVCGALLIWGGEINEFIRRFIMLIVVISTIGFASNIMSSLFGLGALI